ncbi:MAG: RnfABCDGE type electron transport complex subunit G [Vallitaleaceae bacterium]|jgi:electron transport complex protein RnfG|nr:RnfABCDGE type electron transport complex subunit G [Vallitaleaceae bacterium]
MREIIRNGLILFAITVIAGTLLGITNEVTKAPIIEAQKAKTQDALANVFENADFGDEIALDAALITEYPFVSSYYEATINNELAGYAFKVVTSEGYGGNIEFIVGLSIEGHITGIDIIKQAETPGLGAKAAEPEFKDQYIDKKTEVLTVVKNDAPGDLEISAISAATITSKAVTNAVNQVITYYNTELIGGVQ